MALPVAHTAFGLGWSRAHDRRVLLFLALLSVVPDFDFALVWGLGWPIHDFHRTFSHSLLAVVAATAVFAMLRRGWLRGISPAVFFAVLASHSILDMMCTADAADHGVELFWPISGARLGWPVLVPLYRLFASSPFSWDGALRFTVLEILLAVFLWLISRGLRNALERLLARNRRPSKDALPERLMVLPQIESE